MRHLDILSARFGAEHVLGGSSRIVADLDPEGRVLHIEAWKDLAFGELDKQLTPRIEAIAKTLHGAGFEDMPMPDIVAFMWHKWMLLASMAGLTCLLRGSIGEIARAPFGVETEQAFLRETAAIATASGYPPSDKSFANVTARLTDPASTLTASMYRDLKKNSPVEADHILGDLLRRGKALGLQSPLLQAAYVQLSVYSVGEREFLDSRRTLCSSKRRWRLTSKTLCSEDGLEAQCWRRCSRVRCVRLAARWRSLPSREQ